MTDETQEDEVESPVFEFAMPNTAAEEYSWSSASGKGGTYVFPKGVEAWADANGIELVHIDSTTGVITVQHEMGQAFRDIAKPHSTGTVAALKPASRRSD